MEKERTSKSLDHLGLVAGMIDELELVKTIDSKVAQSLSDRHISISNSHFAGKSVSPPASPS